MSHPSWPQVWVIRWHRVGGAPAHRFYAREWYARLRARTLTRAGYDVEVYRTEAKWKPVQP